jgi:Uma2 family endonuclease
VGEAVPYRLFPGLVRLPDISFVSWDRVPVRGQIPDDPVAGLCPDLAFEVLSKGNTRGESQRKLKEYFLARTRLAWVVDPRKRIVTVYTAPDQSVAVGEGETLDGGAVLPGLALPLARLFARVPRPMGTRVTGKKRSTKNGKNAVR